MPEPGIGKLTAEEAVSAGYWRVTFPSWLVMTAFFWAPFLIFGWKVLNTHLAFAGAAMVLGFLAGWLTWSLLVPRWRLWAYREVGDLDQLRGLAAESKLLWRAGHIFERTELPDATTRDELKRLEAEFERRRGAST